MDEKTTKLLNVIVALGVIFLLLNYGRRIVSILTPIAIAILLTLLFLPLIDFLTQKFKSRILAALSVLLPAFALIVWGLWWALAQLYREAERFVLSVPALISNLQTLYDERILPMVRGSRYEETIFVFLDDFVMQAVSWMQEVAKSLIGSGISLVSSLPGLFLAFTVTILLVFYLSYDKKWAFNLIPAAEDNISQVIKLMHGFLKTQLFLIIINAAICMLTFALLGIPYVFILGILIAIFDLLPILGSGTLLVPMVVWYFILGQPFTAIMLGALYGVILVVRQIVEPKLLANNLGIHPVVAILSIYFGLKLFGPVGLILLPLITSIAASFPRFQRLRR
jgi:sporulation integral membrane protein YtvI